MKLDFDLLDWVHAASTKDPHPILVEVADVPGYTLKAIRSSSTYNASIKQLRACIMDMRHFPEWASSTIKAEVVQKIDPLTQACYCEHQAPWPLKNRDGVVVQKAERLDDQRIRISLSANSNLVPKKKGLVRLEYLQGAWLLESQGPNVSKLTYYVHSDPNGHIPDWIINAKIAETPIGTLTNLHRQNLSRYTEEELNIL